MNVRQAIYILLKKNIWQNVNPSSSKLNAGFARVWKDPIKRTLKVEGYFRASTNLTTSDVLFVLPEGYRPSTTFAIPATFITTTTTAVYHVYVKPNGEITQELGSTVKEGMFSGTIGLA